MLWSCKKEHQYLDESHQSPNSLLDTLSGLCLCFSTFFLSGNLFSTSLMIMNLITSFLHNPMRKEDIGLDLLTTKVINLLGRSSLMKPNRLLPDLLLEVPPRLLQTQAEPTRRRGSTTRSEIRSV